MFTRTLLKTFFLILLILACGTLLHGCGSNTSNTQLVGRSRYYPSFPVGPTMKADASGRLYGQFSRYSSPDLGIAFTYISDASVFSTDDSKTTIIRKGNSLYQKDQYSSRLFIIIFTGSNIGFSENTLKEYFHLSSYPQCQLSRAERMDKWGTERNYYMLFGVGEDREAVVCPYQKDPSTVPILIIDKNEPNVVVMTFGCEGCGPEPDFSWVESLKITTK